MSLNASKVQGGGSKRRQQPALEAATYPARLVQVIGLGTQKQRAFQGQEKDPKFDIWFTYELLDEFVIDEEGNEDESKPRWVSERLPLNSLDSDLAKSTKRYHTLDPELKYGGDWSALIGTPCLVTLTKKKSSKGEVDSDGNPVYRNYIANTTPMRERDAAKAEGLKNDPKVFDPSEPDMEVFFALPEWLRGVMKEALDYEGGPLEKALVGVDEKEEADKRRKSNSEEPKEKKSPPKEEPKKQETDDGDDW